MPPKSATKKISNLAKTATKKAPKPPAPKQAAKKAAKQAPRPVKRAASSAKSAASRATKGTGKTKGWVGGQGGASTDLSKWFGPNRNLYLPDGLLDRQNLPAHLDGTLPGDYGYDPLNLGANGNVEKYRVAELIHARWAMLAAAGIIIPEGLAANGANLKGGTWFETGAEMLNGGTLNYFAVPWGIVGNPLPLAAVTLIEVGLVGAAENYRRKGEGPPGYSPGYGKFESRDLAKRDNLYPGGPFDPLQLASDPEVFQELQVKEIKNGRLAMVAVLAFALQGYVTGEGPYANWAKHVSDPFGYNLFTILVGDERVPTL